VIYLETTTIQMSKGSKGTVVLMVNGATVLNLIPSSSYTTSD